MGTRQHRCMRGCAVGIRGPSLLRPFCHLLACALSYNSSHRSEGGNKRPSQPTTASPPGVTRANAARLSCRRTRRRTPKDAVRAREPTAPMCVCVCVCVTRANGIERESMVRPCASRHLPNPCLAARRIPFPPRRAKEKQAETPFSKSFTSSTPALGGGDGSWPGYHGCAAPSAHTQTGTPTRHTNSRLVAAAGHPCPSWPWLPQTALSLEPPPPASVQRSKICAKARKWLAVCSRAQARVPPCSLCPEARLAPHVLAPRIRLALLGLARHESRLFAPLLFLLDHDPDCARVTGSSAGAPSSRRIFFKTLFESCDSSLPAPE